MAPKLKPLSKPEDLAKVPVTEPVLVEIPSSVPEQEPPKVAAKGPQVPVDQPEPETDSGKLKKEYDALKNADKARNEALAKAQKDAADARRAKQESERKLADIQKQNEASVLESVNSGLAAAQAEQEAAISEMVRAREAGDIAAEAKATAKISRAATRIVNYEAAAAELAERAKYQPEPQQRQPEPVDVVTAVQGNAGLLPKEKDWLLAHQELLLDPAEGKLLEAAYIKATRQGHRRGTDAYFQFLDKELGYAETERQPELDGGNESESENTIVAAPVTRSNVSPSGQRPSNQVVLTPEMREMARSMGISEVAYAEQMARLQREKQDNPERFYSPTGR